jgi:WD40 repeat protein
VLWRTYGACENFGILPGGGHKGAILDLHWSRDSKVIYSASADQTLASWDLDTGTRIRKHLGHTEVINCMDVSKRGEEMLVSASDDGYIGVSWVHGSTHGNLSANIFISRSGTHAKRRPSISSRPNSQSLRSHYQKLAMNSTLEVSIMISRCGTCGRKLSHTR